MYRVACTHFAALREEPEPTHATPGSAFSATRRRPIIPSGGVNNDSRGRSARVGGSVTPASRGVHVCSEGVFKEKGERNRGTKVRGNAAGAVRRTCYSDRAGSIVRKCARAPKLCGHMRLIRRVQICTGAIFLPIEIANHPHRSSRYSREFASSAICKSFFFSFYVDSLRRRR